MHYYCQLYPDRLKATEVPVVLDLRISGGKFSGNDGGGYGSFFIDSYYPNAPEPMPSWTSLDQLVIYKFEFIIRIEDSSFSNNIGGVRNCYIKL